ncbi:MAG: agmatine deiminase family protein [Candidatus Fermentibacteraceae bacterium]
MMMLWLTLLFTATAGSNQPEPPFRLAAEWEPSYGTLIRWPLGIPSELVVELARDDSLYVLVENWAQQAEAQQAFASWGVDMGHCRFIETPTNSHWTRDWGPHWGFDGFGECGIIDPLFDGYPWGPGGPYRDYTRSRGYEEDDIVNQALAQELGCPVWQFPAYLTGGNFMVDGHGRGFSVLSMLTENLALWSHEEFLSLSANWLGLSTYNILANPEEYGLQHIDCAAKLLDEETILLKQVPAWHPDYSRLAAINDRLTTEMSCFGRPYNVVRIYCDSYSGNSLAAYTNSYILNGKVFVPMFGIPADEPALQTYQNAMPGYEIIGVHYDSWYYYDALHCRTREMIDREMLLIQHRPLDSLLPYEPQFPVECLVRPYSGAALIPDETFLRYRVAGIDPWTTVPLVQIGGDSLTGQIPSHPVGTVVEYYLSVSDLSGRTETLPRTAPGGVFSFTVDTGLGLQGSSTPQVTGFSAVPNPFQTCVTLTFTLAVPGAVELSVYDLAGRTVMTTALPCMASGSHSLSWNAGGVAPGMYLVSVSFSGEIRTLRVVRVP